MKNLKSILRFLLISCIVLLSTKADTTEPKENERKNLKIINGIPVEAHSRPYMVAIRTNIDDLEVLCGGSLISDSLVLTSAKCVYGATQVELILGAHELDNPNEEGQQTITATEFVIHEDFNPETMEHDIALIQLPRAAPLGKNIATIKLPDILDIYENYDEKEATIAGWGRTNDTSPDNSNILRYQNLTIIPLLTCEISYLLTIKINQLCTSGVSKNNICLGDGGSPLVLDGVQIGIASYGSIYGCSVGFPGVYTKVASYLSWLLLSLS